MQHSGIFSLSYWDLNVISLHWFHKLRSCWLTVWGYTPGGENQGGDQRSPDWRELFLSLLQDAQSISAISSLCD